MCAAVFPKARIRVSGKQGVEVDSGPLAIISELPCWLSGKESACNARDPSLIPGSERSLEKEMATHSNILAWRIPWSEETGGLYA